MNPTRTTGIVGAACVPHAPQFLSRPETEDLDQVERVRLAMAEAGERLRALQPDCIIVLSNDHGDHFVTHSVPAFCVHAAAHADGMHKHRGNWSLDPSMGYGLVRTMEDEGFDLAYTLSAKLPTAFTIPYDFMGFGRDVPMTPIFVNAYVPPQPSALRCHAFGQALARAVARMGRRALLIASGGLSHYPGTAHYPNPDVTTDRELYKQMQSGNLTALLALDEAALDRTGNLELRATLIAAGAMGNRKPFMSTFEPSWHHTYSVMAWDLTEPTASAPLIYPALPPERVALVEALYSLRSDPESGRRYLADPEAWCDSYALAADERQALLEMNPERLRDEFSIHALLTSGAATQLRILRERAAPSYP
jgi:2,3-dihydroxyphenylpropionate 1,2-dioxygenase